jgi:hypothetical protein
VGEVQLDHSRLLLSDDVLDGGVSGWRCEQIISFLALVQEGNPEAEVIALPCVRAIDGSLLRPLSICMGPARYPVLGRLCATL